MKSSKDMTESKVEEDDYNNFNILDSIDNGRNILNEINNEDTVKLGNADLISCIQNEGANFLTEKMDNESLGLDKLPFQE